MGHQPKTGLGVGVRTRDERHLFPRSYQQPSDRLRQLEPSRLREEQQGHHQSGKDDKHSKRYIDNLCLFRRTVLHRGCDTRWLEPTVKTLYKAYDETDGVPMQDFNRVTLEDLCRVQTECARVQARRAGRRWKDDRRSQWTILVSLPRDAERQSARDAFFLHPRRAHVLQLVSISKVW